MTIRTTPFVSEPFLSSLISTEGQWWGKTSYIENSVSVERYKALIKRYGMYRSNQQMDPWILIFDTSFTTILQIIYENKNPRIERQGGGWWALSSTLLGPNGTIWCHTAFSRAAIGNHKSTIVTITSPINGDFSPLMEKGKNCRFNLVFTAEYRMFLCNE